MPDGAKVVQFKLYDAPVGGAAVWAGEVHKLSVNGGLVNTVLGTKTALAGVDFGEPRYLEITIDADADGEISASDPPLLPRQVVLPAVFASEAADARGLDGHSWDILFNNTTNANANVWTLKPSVFAGGSIPASAITANNQISAAHLGAGSVGTSELANSIGVFARSGGALSYTGGNVGIGTGSPETLLHVRGGPDATLSGGGAFMIESLSGDNLVFDANEIMARMDNGSAATLHLNADGGTVNIGAPPEAGETVGSRVYLEGRVLQMANNDFIRFNDGEGARGTFHFIADAAPTAAGNAIVRAATFSTSDGRLKEDIADIENPLELVSKLRPRAYRWKETGEAEHGFLAQELAEVLDFAAMGDPDGDSETDPMAVSYEKVVPVLTAALQELSRKVVELEGEVQTLRDRE